MEMFSTLKTCGGSSVRTSAVLVAAWLSAALVDDSFLLVAAMPALAQHPTTAPSDDKPSVDHGAGQMATHDANQASQIRKIKSKLPIIITSRCRRRRARLASSWSCESLRLQGG